VNINCSLTRYFPSTVQKLIWTKNIYFTDLGEICLYFQFTPIPRRFRRACKKNCLYYLQIELFSTEFFFLKYTLWFNKYSSFKSKNQDNRRNDLKYRLFTWKIQTFGWTRKCTEERTSSRRMDLVRRPSSTMADMAFSVCMITNSSESARP